MPRQFVIRKEFLEEILAISAAILTPVTLDEILGFRDREGREPNELEAGLIRRAVVNEWIAMRSALQEMGQVVGP